MKLQKATQFALYAVLELAADPERQLSAADIAERYGISAHHLAKVLRHLGRAGLVESVRGVGGGYRFSGNARRSTLLDVIEIFEDISAEPEGPGEPGRRTEIGRALHAVLREIEDNSRATLDSITIETVVGQMRRAQHPPGRGARAAEALRAPAK
jgi:Rrf2 family protein